MAVFRCQVFYQRGEGDKWTNVYHLSGADLSGALIAAANELVPGLLPLLHASCRIVKVLVSSMTTDDFVESSIEQAGTSAFTDSMIPFFNCVKAKFNTAGLGRPDLKFYKGWLTEALNDSGVITSLDLSDFTDALNSLIVDMSTAEYSLCSENGDLWSTGGCTLQPAIQMRQMHRKRRHVTP